MGKFLFQIFFVCLCRLFCLLYKLSGCYCSDQQKTIINLMAELAVAKKETEILNRQKNKKAKPNLFDRIFLSVLFYSKLIRLPSITIFRPETVLRWVRDLNKGRWTFPNGSKHPGRPPVKAEIKNLVLDMKLKNLFCKAGSIVGELKKLGIDLDRNTVRKILKAFRKAGKIPAGLIWKNFLSLQIKSHFSSDFLTVDTFFGIRFYVFFIIYHQTREIVQYAVTTNPTALFLKNQFFLFEEKLEEMNIKKAYLIHDNSNEFGFLNYQMFYYFKNVPTSIEAPNMNAIAERFVGTVRRQCLDWFIVFTKKQLSNILCEFIRWYNTLRTHQGINYKVPKGYVPQTEGKIVSEPVLFGLVHHYYRQPQNYIQ